ncbi:MAG TPA: phospholipase D-like domain-containing protein, partial [Elusimicrobiales bacterium]|nr:phospholipase D-like domain-containing protein [Elusimicrobiales bacterium]
MNKTLLTAALAALLAASQQIAPVPAYCGDLELVESVPAETVYGSKDTSRPTDVWPAMINAAQKTLDIEEFYFSAGPALTPVLDAIKAAAARGVKIRIIIDSKYYAKKPAIPDELKKVPGVSLVTLDMGAGVQHAKFFIVDGNQVYVGSQNMDSLSLSQIHEM